MNSLKGIKVVALEQAVSLPLATRHMADLGAEVIKIERPQGDFARGYDSHVHGLSTYFVWLNAGKRSISLNLKSDGARDVALSLIERADVFVQNLGPGVAERLDLGPDQMTASNPRLVYCGLTGYGNAGPYRDRKGYDLLLQGESAAVNVSGTSSEAAKVGISIVDISGGMYVLVSVLAALVERDRTGSGQVLEISLLDSIGEWMQVSYLYTRHTGRPFPRAGKRHNMIVPYGSYSCGDGGSVSFAIQNDREWQRLCRTVLDSPNLVSDPRYESNEHRVTNRDDLESAIEERFAELGVREVARRLAEADIAYGDVREVGDALNHPQFEARDRWRSVRSSGGDITMLRPPFEGAGQGRDGLGIPALAEHTEEILREIGYSVGDVEKLRSSGAF